MALPDKDLFGNPPTHAQQAAAKCKAKRKPTPPRGYIAAPGTGPAGETCGSCAHLARNPGNTRSYLKCGLNRAKWTSGPGSDIRARSPACKKWEMQPPDCEGIKERIRAGRALLRSIIRQDGTDGES